MKKFSIGQFTKISFWCKCALLICYTIIPFLSFGLQYHQFGSFFKYTTLLFVIIWGINYCKFELLEKCGELACIVRVFFNRDEQPISVITGSEATSIVSFSTTTLHKLFSGIFSFYLKSILFWNFHFNLHSPNVAKELYIHEDFYIFLIKDYNF